MATGIKAGGQARKASGDDKPGSSTNFGIANPIVDFSGLGRPLGRPRTLEPNLAHPSLGHSSASLENQVISPTETTERQVFGGLVNEPGTPSNKDSDRMAIPPVHPKKSPKDAKDKRSVGKRASVEDGSDVDDDQSSHVAISPDQKGLKATTEKGSIWHSSTSLPVRRLSDLREHATEAQVEAEIVQKREKSLAQRFRQLESLQKELEKAKDEQEKELIQQKVAKLGNEIYLIHRIESLHQQQYKLTRAVEMETSPTTKAKYQEQLSKIEEEKDQAHQQIQGGAPLARKSSLTPSPKDERRPLFRTQSERQNPVRGQVAGVSRLEEAKDLGSGEMPVHLQSMEETSLRQQWVIEDEPFIIAYEKAKKAKNYGEEKRLGDERAATLLARSRQLQELNRKRFIADDVTGPGSTKEPAGKEMQPSGTGNKGKEREKLSRPVPRAPTGIKGTAIPGSSKQGQDWRASKPSSTSNPSTAPKDAGPKKSFKSKEAEEVAAALKINEKLVKGKEPVKVERPWKRTEKKKGRNTPRIKGIPDSGSGTAIEEGMTESQAGAVDGLILGLFKGAYNILSGTFFTSQPSAATGLEAAGSGAGGASGNGGDRGDSRAADRGSRQPSERVGVGQPPSPPPIPSISIQVNIFIDPAQKIPFWLTAYTDIPVTYTTSQLKRLLSRDFDFPSGEGAKKVLKLRMRGRWLRHGTRTLEQEGARDWEIISVFYCEDEEDWKDVWRKCVEDSDGMAGVTAGWPGTGDVRSPTRREEWVRGKLRNVVFLSEGAS